MRNFILGIVITLVVLALGAYLYVWGGHAPVATNAKPMPFETTLAKKALNARVHKEMPTIVPIAADAATFQAGAQVYKTQCGECHGLPGQPDSDDATSMFPPPPQLFHGQGVSDDPAGETYWKVTNGIRLSGMPSFRTMLSDTERWQVSVMLAHSNELPPAVMQVLQAHH